MSTSGLHTLVYIYTHVSTCIHLPQKIKQLKYVLSMIIIFNYCGIRYVLTGLRSCHCIRTLRTATGSPIIELKLSKCYHLTREHPRSQFLDLCR